MENQENGISYAGSDINAEMLRKHFNPESVKGADILVPTVDAIALQELAKGGRDALVSLLNAVKSRFGPAGSVGKEVAHG